MIFEDVQADHSVGVYVRVVDLCLEGHLGWLEGVVSREVDIQFENSSLVGRVRGTHEHCGPVKDVISSRACGAVCRRVAIYLVEFLIDSF